MKHLITFAVAVIAWLGLFEPHLIKPLAVLPLGAVMSNLTAADVVLLVVTLAALHLSFIAFDAIFLSIKHRKSKRSPSRRKLYKS